MRDSALIVTTLEKLSAPGANFDEIIAEATSRSERFFEVSDKEKKQLTPDELAYFDKIAFDNDSDRIFVNKTV